MQKPHGYRMPAEWEPHAATWLSWPHNRDTWPGKFDPVPGVFVEIVRALREPVHILVKDTPMVEQVRFLLGQAGVLRPEIHLHLIPTNDCWMRDHGPTFLVGSGEPVLLNWGFNSWGGKYGPWTEDDQVPTQIATLLDLPCLTPAMILEGGSIEVNGQGLCLTTEQCLLHPNRNPHLSRAQIEQNLKDYLGLEHILWLAEGIVGDDTDGHIDDLARFVNPHTVVAVLEDNPDDENYVLLQANYEHLQELARAYNLNVVALPMPAPKYYDEVRLPASYANFYIANEVVLVPVFDDPKDTLALDILRQYFPDREVVGIACTDLVWGLGAIHCVTQQQPRNLLKQ
ncbi:agmatine deiminase family protein [Anthocerotibacter panamensis]|uniref:agmatine deiminase family protein n=1 Tax=Anthocerotibacter panamensis TaxID=2857077 RepID=UPI001C402A26|nr:agmatine deiminase family protein [Anthocerotibacter panamensis]